MKSGPGRGITISPAHQERKPTALSPVATALGPIRLGRQREPVDDGFRILLQKQVGDFRAFRFCHLAVTTGEKRGSPLDVVGIAGKEVDQAGVEPPLRKLARMGAEPTRVRLRRDLHQASNRNPFRKQIRFTLEEGVPFRVCNDRLEPGDLDVVIHAAEVVRNKLVREFHQQVRSLIDGEIFGILRADLDVVVGKMKVAAQQEFGSLANFFLELGTQLPVEVRVEFVAVIAVRRRHQMRYTILCRDSAHRDCHLKGPGAIVYTR